MDNSFLDVIRAGNGIKLYTLYNPSEDGFQSAWMMGETMDLERAVKFATES